MFIIRFLKNWTLPVAIVAGIVAYLIYAHLHIFDATRPYAAPVASVVQPVLIFSMLFLSFCKIDVRQLRLRRSHLWLLLLQCGAFVALGLLLHFVPQMPGRILIEGAALCIVCPTATAAAVVTQKLEGDAADVTMYTILSNIAVALVVPLMVPLVHPHAGQTFWVSFALILSKVFPMLICPLIAAQLIRWLWPRAHAFFTSFRDLAFYLWAVSLSIAIAVTTRSIAHSHEPLSELVALAIVSLVCCITLFGLGRVVGRRYGRPISSAQGLGQKNTIFGIWMGYTFLNPVTSIAGGFYSVWHNCYNTYQLRRKAQGK